MDNLDLQLLRDSLLAAVREDVGAGDITSHATIPANARATGRYTTKQTVVVAGVPVIREIMRLVDSDLQFDAIASDGCSVATGAVLAEVHGSARSILAVERTSLNLLQRMCGIATLTHQYVDRIAGTRTRIVDTRKTAPGLRVLDKYAVSCGGGMNHRMGLFDGVLIKNNHLIFHPSVAHAIQEARRKGIGRVYAVEVIDALADQRRPKPASEKLGKNDIGQTNQPITGKELTANVHAGLTKLIDPPSQRRVGNTEISSQLLTGKRDHHVLHECVKQRVEFSVHRIIRQ